MGYVTTKLSELVATFSSQWMRSPFGLDHFENELMEIVTLCKNNLSVRQQSDFFVESLRERRAPFQLYQFCMRHLKLLDVKEAAIRIRDTNSDHRVIGGMNGIQEEYEDNWEEEELFQCFSQQENN